MRHVTRSQEQNRTGRVKILEESEKCCSDSFINDIPPLVDVREVHHTWTASFSFLKYLYEENTTNIQINYLS